MEFQILGPLEVRREGRAVPLDAAKQRALLAILLLRANEVVSSDRLIEELWTDPPRTATNTLQVYVGKLRKALERDGAETSGQILLTRAPGYMVRVAPGQLDAERFESLLSEGRTALEAGESGLASDTLSAALELWRGPALADFTYEPFAQAEIARLEELRVVALEERIEADLALGRHAELIAELEALIAEHPLRERLRGLLMLALYRCDRQADSLEAYREAHRALADELAIEPSETLRSLEASILRHDSSLDPPSPGRSRQDVGQPPAERGASPRETRKIVTVLVARGSEVPGLDPEAVQNRERLVREAVAQATQRYGGTVESARGNTTTVVFGVPTVHEDDALRAARAALDARRAIEGGPAGNGALAVSFGIATGEVLAGETAPGELSIVGEPVSIAAELEAAAPANDILLATQTRELLRDAVRVSSVAGTDHPAWSLLELAPEPPPLSRPSETPIVGRQDELARLREALERTVRKHAAHLFTILGPPGIGKSRLTEEFAAGVADKATIVAGRCVPYGEGITFWPLREIVSALTTTASLPALLAGEERTKLIVERITEAIGIADASSTREEIFWAFRRLFEAIARERPLVIVFEDIHWAEPTFLDLVEYLAEGQREAPILLLCLARPELLEQRPAWGHRKGNASSLLLEQLPDAECDLLLDSLAHGLTERSRGTARESAEGNPLFLEQMVAMLAEAEDSIDEPAIPASIEALLASRLDRLGPGERAVIERAAVVGRQFWARAVADLLPEDAQPFAARHLEALLSKDLVSSTSLVLASEEALEFRHVLIQQAAYRAIPKRLRATLHESFGAWLEEGGDGTDEFEEIVGHHLERAFRYRTELGQDAVEVRNLARRAAERLGSAGKRAFRRGDMPAAVALLDRAASLHTADDQARLELLPELGYALFEVGELERAMAVLTEAVDQGRACGDRRVEWRAAVKRGQIQICTQQETANLERLSLEAREGIEVLERLGDDAGLSRAWYMLAGVRGMAGQLVTAGEASARAAEHARRSGNPREAAWALGERALQMLHGPTPVAEAKTWIERSLHAAAGNPVLEAHLPAFLAVLEAMTGRFADARELVERSRKQTEELALTWQLGLIHAPLSGFIELLAGDPEAAERELRAARRAFAEINDTYWLATVSADLPRPVYELGRYEEAWALVEAIEEAPAPADCEWQIKRRGVRGMLLAREGDSEQAEILAREAVAIAAETDLLWFHADALIDLAEVLKLTGRAQDAARAAEEGRRLHELKGNVVSAQRASELTR